MSKYIGVYNHGNQTYCSLNASLHKAQSMIFVKYISPVQCTCTVTLFSCFYLQEEMKMNAEISDYKKSFFFPFNLWAALDVVSDLKCTEKQDM